MPECQLIAQNLLEIPIPGADSVSCDSYESGQLTFDQFYFYSKNCLQAKPDIIELSIYDERIPECLSMSEQQIAADDPLLVHKVCQLTIEYIIKEDEMDRIQYESCIEFK